MAAEEDEKKERTNRSVLRESRESPLPISASIHFMFGSVLILARRRSHRMVWFGLASVQIVCLHTKWPIADTCGLESHEISFCCEIPVAGRSVCKAQRHQHNSFGHFCRVAVAEIERIWMHAACVEVIHV